VLEKGFASTLTTLAFIMKKRISQEEKEFNALAKLPQKRTAKKESRKAWVKKSDIAFSLFIRARDMVCIKCRRSSGKLDCSHVIPRQYKILRWDERNANAMCYYCHMTFWHGNPGESGDWYRNRYPENWEYLSQRKLIKWSPTVDELKDIYNKYNLIYSK